MPPRTPRPEPHREGGTASMEALLCLPFLLVVLALVLNVGHGWIVRQRAEGAVRFAGVQRVTLVEAGAPPAEARRAARAATRSYWYPGGDAARVEFGHPLDPVAGALRGEHDPQDTGLSRTLGILGDLLSGRRESLVEAPRRPPTGTLVPATPVTTWYALDANTWTHGEVPLSFDSMTELDRDRPLSLGLDLPVRIVQAVGRGLFWMLGMVP